MYPFYSSTTLNRFFSVLVICLFAQPLLAQVPVISLVTPSSGAVGATVTITGANFSNTAANNTVYFGAVKATVSAASANTLTVTVPAGATYQPISVTVNNLTAWSPLPFTVTFAGGGVLAPISFVPVTYFNSGSWPESETAGDLDGDGRADIVTANGHENSMTIHKNTSTPGNVNFAPKLVFTNNNWRLGSTVAISDIDGDGKPDIALCNSSDRKIYFYLNTSVPGTISFANPFIFTADSGPGMAFADFDGDGKPDAAVIGNPNVSVFRNTSTPGNISFAPKTDFAGVNTYRYQYITAADFNEDGKPDMAFAEYDQNRVWIYKNTGSNGVMAFAPRVAFIAGKNPQYIAAGDFNSDGKLDMAVTNYGDSSVSLFRNTTSAGNIAFDPKADIALDNQPLSISLGNINGDAMPDMIIGKNLGFSGVLTVLQNNTTGAAFAFSPAIDYAAGYNPNSIVTCDLDNDGKADLSSSITSSLVIAVLRNRMSEPIVNSFSPTGGPAGTSITISGSLFTGTNAVTVGGVPVSSFTVVSDTVITAVVGAGASGSVAVTNAFGTGSKPGYTFGPAPLISSFTPAAARQGAMVQIKGTGLSGTTTVRFGGVPAQFVFNDSDTSISAMVGTGASGSVSVTTATGTASLPGFTFLPPPVISTVSPDSGFTGATVTITGVNFTGATAVRLGGIPAASFSILSDTSLTAVVGNGATGSITITGPGGNGSGGNFRYLGPNISSFTPSSGGLGTTVTITGTNFTGVTAVQFGGIPAASYTVNSATSITAVTGIGASGDITVTTAAGTGTRGTFLMPPRITSFSPQAGPVGTVLTIHGNGFSPAPGTNAVYIGGVSVGASAATTTSLTVTVPAGMAYLPAWVRTNNFIAGFSAQPFTTTFASGPFTPAYFAQRQPLVTAASPLRTAMCDLNKDRKPELITSNADGSLSVYKNASTPGNTVFNAPVNYPTSSNANATGLAIGDFTADASPDIAMLNYGSNTVTVFQNKSISDSIAINPGVIFATGNNPIAIAAGDVDGDGRTDMAVANYSGNSVSLFRSTSLFSNIPSFAARVDFSTGVNPNALSLADIDGDGKLDMAVVNETAATVSIFRNTGTSGAFSFAPRVDVATASFPRSIAMADFDGDGDMDMVISNAGASSVSVFKNTSTSGSISFDPKVDLATASGSNSVAVNDMDGDGKLDITATNFGAASFSVFKNTSAAGGLSFAAKVDYPLTDYPGHHTTGDADGDGKPDIAAVDGQLVIIRNKVNDAPVITSFSPAAAYPGDTIIITGNNFTGATAATFGGTAFNSFTVLSDKTIRAIPGAGSSGDISVTTPYGTATLAGFSYTLPPAITGISPVSGPVGSTVTITGSNFNPVAAGNIVSFGTARAVVTAATASSITVLVPAGASQQHIAVLANGRTAYSAQVFSVTFPGAGPAITTNDFDTTRQVILPGIDGVWGLGTGDIDGDGKTDLALSITSGSTRYFSTTRNISDSNTLAFAPRTNHLTNQGGSGTHPVIDIDGDGKPELVFHRGQDAYPVTIFKNNSTTGVINLQENITLYYSKVGGFKVCAADVDADGRADLLIKSDYAYDIVVCRNTTVNGTVSFAAPVVVGGAGNGFNSGGQVIAEDFSGDGRPDIAVITDDKVTVLKNTGAVGSIAFGPAVNFTSGGNARLGFAADIDGDGRMDIAKSSYQNNAVAVLRNNSAGGNISFETAVPIATGFTPAAMAIADMDGDGKADICVNKDNSKVLAVLKNTSTAGIISFAPKTEYTGNGPNFIALSDIDNDGRPEIVTANYYSNIISLLRNNIGGPFSVALCPPAGNATITSNITGAAYQWQVNTGSGFTNISDGINYSNTNAAALQLINAPSAWYGYQYRCVAGGANSNVFVLKFSNRWSGAISTDWSNPANWSCGAVPDANTDVVINSGTVVISSNVTIRSLKINPGASLTVAAGFTLTVLY
jgi:FG-GAP-like repeat/IPT/TIG domain